MSGPLNRLSSNNMNAMGNNEDLKVLIQKYQDGTCTEQQRRLIEDWYASRSVSNADFDFPENFWQDKEAGLQQILFSSQSKHKDLPSFKFSRRIAAMAATITVILGVGIVVFSTNSKKTNTGNVDIVDISTAVNQATLTLTNGRTINLSGRDNGHVAVDQGINITKTKDGILIYEFNPDHANVSGLNVLSTPRGGQYQVILPDKSKVWLNAGSVLEFPSSFNGLSERKVWLKGEAYFEVAQMKSNSGMKSLPFIVKTRSQEVIVLGTHFNIKSYVSEPDTKTSLLEGSVRISAPALPNGGTMLKPGEQSINNGNGITVQKVNADEILSWKNREFIFNNEPLEVIMREVARWYNVDIKYKDQALKAIRMGCVQSRDAAISDVLRTFEAAGVHFVVKGREVTVMK